MELGFLLRIRSSPKTLFLIIRLPVGEGAAFQPPYKLRRRGGWRFPGERRLSQAANPQPVGSWGTPQWEITGVRILTRLRRLSGSDFPRWSGSVNPDQEILIREGGERDEEPLVPLREASPEGRRGFGSIRVAAK